MGAIITVAQSKGGAGKTTAILALAPALVAAGYQVAVVDADRNQSFADWHRYTYDGPPFTVATEIDNIRVVDLAARLADTHDLVLVDTAGFENLTAAACIGMADFVMVPVMPDRGSLREAMRTSAQVGSLARAARRDIPHACLLTRWSPRGLAERAALESLHEAGLPVLAGSLSNSAVYAKASLSGIAEARIALEARNIIDDLKAYGAIPPRSLSRVVA